MMHLPARAVHSTTAHSLVARVIAGGRTLCCCAFLLATISAAHAPLLMAQSAQQLDTLLFDPIPLAVTTSEDGSVVMQELTSLPQGEAVELRQWLEANRPLNLPADETPEAGIRRNQLLVQETEINEGPYSPSLPQQLQALGSALQASGELDQAQRHFDQAMHIARVNHGLFSDAQIPYIHHSINNQLLKGDLLAADEQQRYLFYLNQKNLGSNSAELLPALQDFADWNIFAFNAPASMSAQMMEDGGANAALFRVERLLNAQHIYWSIAQILISNFGISDPRLLDAEKRIALTNWFFATSIASDAEALHLGAGTMPGTPSGLASTQTLGNMGYRQGRDALERRRNYMREMDAVSKEELLSADLDLADWMLYFSRQRMKGVEMYQDIRSEYSGQLPPEALAAILDPAYPERLPSFIKPAWSRAALGLPEDQALQYKGHIDVEFSLNRFGKTTSLQVLASSNPDARLVEQRLLRSLRNSQFRPRFDGDKLRDSDRIQARYYYTW